MNHLRAAEIYHPDPNKVGSGYLIARNLVLTALHVFHNDEIPNRQLRRDCEVRLLDDVTRERAWRGGRLVWPTDEEWDLCARTDLALVEITPDADTAALAEAGPPVWTRPGAEDDVDCSASGYPDGRVFNKDDREIWLMRGSTNFVSGSKQGILFVGLTGEENLDPAKRFGDPEDWRGFSGAGLFAGACLVGVVTRVMRRESSLKAIRIDCGLRFESFRRWIGAQDPGPERAATQADPAGSTMMSGLLRSRRRTVTDIRKPRWEDVDIRAVAAAITDCRSFYDADVRDVLLGQIPNAQRPGAKPLGATEQDARALVKAAVNVDALSAVLRIVRLHEEGSRAWKALVWALLELREPALSVESLRRLSALGESLPLADSDRLGIFLEVARTLQSVDLDEPGSWQDCVALLADFGADRTDPPVISLAVHMRELAPLETRPSLDAWIEQARRQLGIGYPVRNISGPVTDREARLEAREGDTSDDVRLIFEVSRGIVQPGKGFVVWAFLLAGGRFENLGAAECADLPELREWVTGHLDDVGRKVRGVKPILEFVLPEEMFGEEVDRWPQYHDDTKSTPLGLVYPVVLRSRWRLRDRRAPRHWADWERWWRGLCQHGCGEMRWIGTARGVSPDGLYAELASGLPCGIGFGFVPQARSALDLYGRALRAGAPVLLWARRKGMPEALAEAELLCLVRGNVRELPHRLHARRLEAAKKAKDDVGLDIVALWDDADRNLERDLNQPMTTRGLCPA